VLGLTGLAVDAGCVVFAATGVPPMPLVETDAGVVPVLTVDGTLDTDDGGADMPDAATGAGVLATGATLEALGTGAGLKLVAPVDVAAWDC
jgi:hypothetical protein